MSKRNRKHRGKGQGAEYDRTARHGCAVTRSLSSGVGMAYESVHHS